MNNTKPHRSSLRGNFGSSQRGRVLSISFIHDISLTPQGSFRRVDARKTAITIFLSLLFISLLRPLCAEEEVLFSVKYLSDRALFWDLKDARGTNIVVLKSQQGLVVVDTEKSSQIAGKLKETIADECGRSDFVYIINTHHHWDHSNGNYAFRGIPVVGHDLCIKGMQDFYARRKDFADKYREGWLSYLEEQRGTLDPGTQESRIIREQLRYGQGVYRELMEGFVSVPPSITFSDRATLHLGDMTVGLIHFGLCHTESDILIHVPEENMLIVGDTFQKNELVWIDENAAVKRWLRILNNLLNDELRLDYVIPGHGEVMTGKELTTQRDYVQELWDGVGKLRDDGCTLEEAKDILSFEKHFPYLKHISHTWDDGTDYHILNIEHIWKIWDKSYSI